MSNFNNNSTLLLNNNTHPIIQQKNTFSLDKRFLTIHAIDREQHFYKNSNNFSIKTPQSYNNVQSLRLTEINFPNKVNNFSNILNNNTLNLETDIIIPDGNYSYEDLANYLNNVSSINVKYLKNRQRFIFYKDTKFDLKENKVQNTTKYNNNHKRSNNTINAFNSEPKINEGFLYDIGFDISSNTISSTISASELNDIISDKHYIMTQSPPRFRDKQPIYMEIDSLNINYDELNPFPSGTNNMFTNLSNASSKTAFIKIPPNIYNNDNGNMQYDYLQNCIAFFEAPLKRIQNFKFKFRYHDNKLVDLDNQDINFTLEINQLTSNMHKHMMVQTPIL